MARYYIAILLLFSCRHATDSAERVSTQSEPPVGDLVPGASLIVRAVVVDNNTSVKASAMQIEVAPDQGWAAALIRPTRVLKGSQPGDLIMVNNMAVRDNTSGWRRPVETTNGQERIFYLRMDERLSRWCRMNVYQVILESEAK